MPRAYDEMYLDCAQRNLSRMLDYGTRDLGYEPEEFFALFISTGLARKFGKGDFRYLAGMSGIELAHRVMEAIGQYHDDMPEATYTQQLTPEYWAGWALAYYQWYSGRTFEEIIERKSIPRIIDGYRPYHEMDITQFVDWMEGRR